MPLAEVILLWSAVVGGIRPGADSSRCATDSASKVTLNFAKVLMTSGDSLNVSDRYVYGLPRLKPADVVLVEDSATCSAAATAYSNRLRGTYPGPLPNRVAVVNAGRYHFVQVIDPPTENPEEIWEIALFTREWKMVVSFGGGS